MFVFLHVLLLISYTYKFLLNKPGSIQIFGIYCNTDIFKTGDQKAYFKLKIVHLLVIKLLC